MYPALSDNGQSRLLAPLGHAGTSLGVLMLYRRSDKHPLLCSRFPGFHHAELMEGVFGFVCVQESFIRRSQERANAPLVLTLAGLSEFGLT